MKRAGESRSARKRPGSPKRASSAGTAPKIVVSFRERLIDGFVEAVTKQSYGETKIADIVSAAKVSKRTFYEHFVDKEDCFLAVYEREASALLDSMLAATNAPTHAEDKLDAALGAYFEKLAENPALTRTCLLEIQSAGKRGLALRRRILSEFATALTVFVELVRSEQPELGVLSHEMAFAVVGGINELVLLGVDGDAPLDADLLRRTAFALLRSVLRESGRAAASQLASSRKRTK